MFQAPLNLKQSPPSGKLRLFAEDENVIVKVVQELIGMECVRLAGKVDQSVPGFTLCCM